MRPVNGQGHFSARSVAMGTRGGFCGHRRKGLEGWDLKVNELGRGGHAGLPLRRNVRCSRKLLTGAVVGA